MFVTYRASHRAFKDGHIINAILKDALAATDQKPVTLYVGSHLLRHSLTTQSKMFETKGFIRRRGRSTA